MDTTTLLILIIVILIVFGGGWYGRGRWYSIRRPSNSSRVGGRRGIAFRPLLVASRMISQVLGIGFSLRSKSPNMEKPRGD